MADHTPSTDSPEQAAPKRKGLLRAWAIDLSPLKSSRDFRLLFIGQFVSVFGSSISYVVLPWQMYQLTRSNFAVGMLGVAEFVPMFVMAFVGGALADYIDRRRLIIIAELGLTVCCGVLVTNAMSAHPRVWVLFLVASLFAALNGVHRPAHEALTPRLVKPEQLPAVAALGMFRWSFSFIAGPALAGLVATGFGSAVAFALDAATFVISIITLAMIRSVPMPAKRDDEDRPSLKAVAEGLKYARSRQELLGTYLIDINAMFFGMPIALFPAIA